MQLALPPPATRADARLPSEVDADWLAARLARLGVDLSSVARRGGGAWLFGSRAAGCGRADSDWDVLLIDPRGGAGRERCGSFDLVRVALAEARCGWSRLELASHTAAFGVRLAGRLPLPSARPLEAAALKAGQVRRRSALLDRLWDAFPQKQRRAEALRLRRDVQRAWLLSNDHPVPPTAFLDEWWRQLDEAERHALSRSSTQGAVTEAVCSS